jgi:hypothetical protein
MRAATLDRSLGVVKTSMHDAYRRRSSRSRRPEARSGPGKSGALAPWFQIGEEHVNGVEGVELLRHQSKVILCPREPAASGCQKGATKDLKNLKGLKSLNV